MNLATLTQAPTTIAVGGRTYKIGPFRYLELGVIQRHLDERCPAPAPQIGDSRWVEALFATLDGVALFLNLLFGKHQEFTGDDLAEVMAHVGPKQIGPLFRVAMEEPPDAEGAGGGDDPKADAAPSTS